MFAKNRDRVFLSLFVLVVQNPTKFKEIYMQRIFSAIGQAFAKRILLFTLMSLLSLSGLFVFANQPALADKPLNSPSKAEETIDRAYTLSEGTGLKEEARQEAYEEATEAINDPKGLYKT